MKSSKLGVESRALILPRTCEQLERGSANRRVTRVQHLAEIGPVVMSTREENTSDFDLLHFIQASHLVTTQVKTNLFQF